MTPVKLRHMHFRHGAYYYVRRVGGKVVWKRLSADLSEAVRLWQQIEGETSKPLTRTVAAAIDRYLLHKADKLAESTVAAYGKHRRRLEAAFAEFSDVAQIRSTHVYEYKEKSGIDYAQALAGHASATMTEAYVARRSVTKVRPIR
jgi:integrase